MLKIISGTLKNRVIPIIPKAKFKPSTSRSKEAIFSIINADKFPHSLENSNMLDVFCGSGGVGLEALSGGAKSVCFVDMNAEQMALLKDFIKKVEMPQRVSFMLCDAGRMPKAKQPYEIIFLDPPYFENLASKALTSLYNNNWLAPDAIIILELALKEDFTPPSFCKIFDMRNYGRCKIIFMQLENSNA